MLGVAGGMQFIPNVTSTGPEYWTERFSLILVPNNFGFEENDIVPGSNSVISFSQSVCCTALLTTYSILSFVDRYTTAGLWLNFCLFLSLFLFSSLFYLFIYFSIFSFYLSVLSLSALFLIPLSLSFFYSPFLSCCYSKYIHTCYVSIVSHLIRSSPSGILDDLQNFYHINNAEGGALQLSYIGVLLVSLLIIGST